MGPPPQRAVSSRAQPRPPPPSAASAAAAASGLRLITLRAPGSAGPATGRGRGWGGGPRAVITAAVATARRVSASSEINWRRRRGRERGQRSTQSHNERHIDRPQGQQLAATGMRLEVVMGIRGAEGAGQATHAPQSCLSQGAVAAAPFAVAPECPPHRPGLPFQAPFLGGAIGSVPDSR